MGCSPSSMARSSAPDSGETTAAAGTVATTNEKDGNLFFCIKLRRSRLRRCSQQNGAEGSGGSGTGSGSAVVNGDDMCNQALLSPLQIKGEADYEKVSLSFNSPQLNLGLKYKVSMTYICHRKGNKCVNSIFTIC